MRLILAEADSLDEGVSFNRKETQHPYSSDLWG